MNKYVRTREEGRREEAKKKKAGKSAGRDTVSVVRLIIHDEPAFLTQSRGTIKGKWPASEPAFEGMDCILRDLCIYGNNRGCS